MRHGGGFGLISEAFGEKKEAFLLSFTMIRSGKVHILIPLAPVGNPSSDAFHERGALSPSEACNSFIRRRMRKVQS